MRFVAGQGAAAESHREYVAGQGAAAESHREYVAGRGAVAESLCGRGCSPAEAVAAAAWKRLPLRGSRCGTNGRACCCRCEAQRGTIGKHMRAGRSTACREKQCGLLVDEDGEVVPSEYLLRHTLELCSCETLYLGTGGLHWLYVAEDHH